MTQVATNAGTQVEIAKPATAEDLLEQADRLTKARMDLSEAFNNVLRQGAAAVIGNPESLAEAIAEAGKQVEKFRADLASVREFAEANPSVHASFDLPISGGKVQHLSQNMAQIAAVLFKDRAMEGGVRKILVQRVKQNRR